MPKIVEVPGVGNVEFPDSMSDEQISAQIQQQSKPAAPAEKSVGGFLGNVLSSGANLATQAASAVLHPIDTANAVIDLGAGVVEKALPGEQAHERNVDALVNHFTGRYGSIDAAKEALYNDPMGVVADLSTLLGGAGAVAKGVQLGAKAAGAAKVATTAGKVAQGARTAAAATDPLGMAARGVQAGSKAVIPAGTAAKLYEGALAPHKGKFSIEEARQMAKTAVENGLPISESGLAKLWDEVDAINAKVSSVVKDRAQQGMKIHSQRVADRADQVKPKFDTMVPRRDQKVIENARQEFLEDVGGARHGTPATPPTPTGVLGPNGQPIMKPGTPATPATPSRAIPVDELHRRKVNTYQKLKDDYGKMGSAEVEVHKALARGAAEELKAAIPELAELLGKEGKLLELAPVLETAIRRQPSLLGGFKSMLTAGATHEMTGSAKAAAAAGAVHALVSHPYVKSRLAIAINRAQQAQPGKYGKPSMATAASRIEEYLKTLEATAQQSGQPALATAQ